MARPTNRPVRAQQPVEDGEARLEVEVDERHLNPAGTVHGGMLATLVDTTMGAAVRSADDGEVPRLASSPSPTFAPVSRAGWCSRPRCGSVERASPSARQMWRRTGKSLVHALATFALIGS